MTTDIPKHANLVAAMAAAQGEFGPIAKDKKAEAGSRGSYRYADMADVLEVVRPVLSRHGIAIIQHLEPLDGGALMLHTELRGWGEALESSIPIVAQLGSPQIFGGRP